ncbi:DUF7940 domain-containing protein [Sphingomonas zeae]
MKLIPNWRQSWRWWSVRVSAFGAMIFAFLLAAPDQALAIWQALPADVQALIPNAKEIGLFLTIAVVVTRVVQQRAKASPTVAAKTDAAGNVIGFAVDASGHLKVGGDDAAPR